MSKSYQKTGIQSADDPFKFIMSTASVDRMGDSVTQDFDLRAFRKNPIALFNHNSNFPIGTWQRVGVVSGALTGHLKLAKAGTSKLIDEVRSLLEQRILKAVSIGFTSSDATPIKNGDGYTLSKNHLMECSLVSVPANSEALLAKGISPELRAMLAQDRDVRKPSIHTRYEKMNLSEQIQSKKDAVVQIGADIDALKSLADTELRDMTDDEIKSYDDMLDQRDRMSHLVKTLERDEGEAATRAKPAVAEPVSNAVINIGGKREQASLIFAGLGNMIKGAMTMKDPMQIASENYRGDKEVALFTDLVQKASIDPAMTTVPEWAGALVQDQYGGFMDLLKAVSVYPRVPGSRHVFSGGSIKIPMRDAAPMINGDWVAEGAPIPVKKLAFKSATLTPKKLAVISSYTREMLLSSSNPNIEQIIRQGIIDDTAIVLDTTFLDNDSGSTVRPEGLKHIAGTATSASAGATAANILTDIGKAVGGLVAAHMGNSAVWIMNPAHRIGLSGIMLANGAFLFRDEVNAGTFAGFPVIMSNNVPKGDVFLVDSNALTFANNFGPEFMISNQATLHMEDDVAKVKPIVGAGSGTAGAVDIADVASPVRSLYQTDTWAIRMVHGLDWAKVRDGGVFYLSGVSW